MKGKVLLCSDYFPPSVGGMENRMADMAGFLQRDGYEVHILTRTLKNRVGSTWQNCTVHSVDLNGCPPLGTLRGKIEDARRIVTSENFEWIFVTGAPQTWVLWVFEDLSVQTPILLSPCINRVEFDALQTHPVLSERLVSLLNRRSAIAMTFCGYDTRFFDKHKIPYTVLPNPVVKLETKNTFRTNAGIGKDTFVITCPANFVPDKGQRDLVQAVSEIDGDWLLYLVGFPQAHEKNYYEALLGDAQKDKRIRIIPGLSRQELAELRAASDLIALPSRAEGLPLSLLEAMAQGIPWLTTPEAAIGFPESCQGGRRAPVKEFSRLIEELRKDKARRLTLGRAGREWWEEHHQWKNYLDRLSGLVHSTRDRFAHV